MTSALQEVYIRFLQAVNVFGLLIGGLIVADVMLNVGNEFLVPFIEYFGKEAVDMVSAPFDFILNTLESI